MLHGSGGAPGKITAEAKAALTGTVMVPTAAGGQVRWALVRGGQCTACVCVGSGLRQSCAGAATCWPNLLACLLRPRAFL